MKKTILVTGASGALGKVISSKLASNGNNLIISARDEEKLVYLKNSLNGYQVEIRHCSFDFSDINSFDVLVSSAAIGIHGVIIMPPQPSSTPEILPSMEDWESLFKSSFIGPAVLLKELLPYLLKNKSSKIVLISGISSIQPLSNYATSNVIRTAWLGLSKTLSDKYGCQGVRINTLSLGGVMTDFFLKKIEQESKNAGKTSQEILEEKVSNVPLRRYAELEEVASMVNFLINSEASEHLTGQNLALDGGFVRPY